MKIIIWTQNKAKTKAILDASKKCVYFKDPVEIIWVSAESWVSDQPRSIDETILWAQNRAHNLKDNWNTGDYYIWIEWGIHKILDKVYLFWVIYILNNHEESHLGMSSFIEVPAQIAQRVYENNEELWPVQAELCWDADINHKWGSFGLWSDDTITRSRAFEDAFYCAIAPFFNKYYK